MSDIKQELYNQCVAYVQARMAAAEDAYKDAEKASNDDTKSSAGDKYETGRAMMQQEKDRNTIQVNEANKLMVALTGISIKGNSDTVDTGSVVITDNGKFYIAISAGTLKVDDENYFAVSAAAPIVIKMLGKKAGEEFDVNGKSYKILEVL
ncbi:3-oxoacyl-ACP synthase [Mucilaginibacter sp.]